MVRSREKKFLENKKVRMTTYSKRTKSILKKAEELSILCDVKACVIIYGPGKTNPDTFPANSDDITRCIIPMYKNANQGTTHHSCLGRHDHKNIISTPDCGASKTHPRFWDRQLKRLIRQLDSKIEIVDKEIHQRKRMVPLMEETTPGIPIQLLLNGIDVDATPLDYELPDDLLELNNQVLFPVLPPYGDSFLQTQHMVLANANNYSVSALPPPQDLQLFNPVYYDPCWMGNFYGGEREQPMQTETVQPSIMPGVLSQLQAFEANWLGDLRRFPESEQQR